MHSCRSLLVRGRFIDLIEEGIKSDSIYWVGRASAVLSRFNNYTS